MIIGYLIGCILLFPILHIKGIIALFLILFAHNADEEIKRKY
jgi:hypothetical protein